MSGRPRAPKTWLFLFSATGGALLFALASFTAVSLYALKNTAYRQTTDNLRQFSYAVANFLDSEHQLLEPAALQQFCERFGAEPDFRISVIDQDGTVIADSNADPEELENHSNRPEVEAALGGTERGIVRFSTTLGKRLVYYAIPYQSYAIRLAVTVDYVDMAAGQVTLIIICAASAILLFAMLGTLLVARKIVTPLTIVERSAVSWAAGNLANRSSLTSETTRQWPREIASLAGAFSQMAERLDERMAALNERDRETGAILGSMNDALIVLDSDMTVLRVNSAAERLFAVSSRESCGVPLIQSVRNTDIVDFAAANHGKDAEQTIELRGTRSSAYRSILVRTAPILPKSAGRPAPSQLLVFSDITRLKLLERVRKDFVANVSHELKTPITSIKGFIETLKDGALEDTVAARRFLDIMDQQSSRMSAIIDDLLAISRLEQGENVHLSREMTDIGVLLASVGRLSADAAAKKKTELFFDSPPALQASLNPGLIEQALTNLVINAITYSPEKSTVRISASIIPADGTDGASVETLVFAVRDNGPGISERYHQRIFERFYRIDKGRSRENGGTGLGLSIVKHIALIHGGTVELESAEGSGSIFRIRLPQKAQNGS